MRESLKVTGARGLLACLAALGPLCAAALAVSASAAQAGSPQLLAPGQALPVQPLAPAQPVAPAAVIPVPVAPPPANPQLLRISTGAELWSIPDAALERFARDGTFSDQRLLRLVASSGWPDDQLRAALLKPYAVDLVAVARFLDSAAGQAFLHQQTRAYRPFLDPRGGRDLRVPALRAAILAEARGGSLTALGILRRLPVPLVLDLAGPSPLRCSALPCDNPLQCSSVMSWLVFLPACLQAAAGQA